MYETDTTYREVQATELDKLMAVAPPAGMTDAQLDQWLEGALAHHWAMQAERPALYEEHAIEDDYDFIRMGC